MIRIAVCEDSIPVQAQIEDHISEMLTDCPVEVFSSGEELLSFLSREKRRFSLYLMDISLPGISGIETAAAIRERDPYALIIYITDYKEYVYEVFETLPYRFITKPIDKDIFHKAISDAVNYITDRGELFHFHVDRIQYQIPFQEIVYFESHLRRITLHTEEEAVSFYGKLQELPDVAVSVKTEFSFFFLMMVPENVGGNHIDPAHLHLEDRVLPLVFMDAGIMAFAADAEKRLSVDLHIISVKPKLIPLRVFSEKLIRKAFRPLVPDLP